MTLQELRALWCKEKSQDPTLSKAEFLRRHDSDYAAARSSFIASAHHANAATDVIDLVRRLRAKGKYSRE